MPKSKRDKKISLTKTKKKGLEAKHKIIDEIRTCIDKYSNIFVFSYENMRNNFLKDIRLEWKETSRFFLGKNRVMAIALGRTSSEEVAENAHLISQKLVGFRGLLFTNASKDEVLRHFDSYYVPDYARTGNTATETVELPEGPLEQFPHSLEPHLRKLGLPTELKRGIPALIKSHRVCKKGDILSPEQARILKLLGKEMANFHMKMEFMWSKDGSFDDFGRATGISFTKKLPAKRTDRKRRKPKEEKRDSVGENGADASAENEDQETVSDDEQENMDDDDEMNEEAAVKDKRK